MKRERATATEPPEPIRPIVRRVIVAMPGEQGRACADEPLVDLQDPFIRSVWGDVVMP
ncbi:MAG TPA: hypothetical protein VFK04_12825 [Gemmatimonadaceae bacterium]|nr:hypothetical protein [Gemmatimonadaceae bacterium]